MTPQLAFNIIKSAVMKKQNYVPRNYETIGGIWTVDTYILPGVAIIKQQDQGYTTRILTPHMNVSQTYNFPIVFHKGSQKDLVFLAKGIQRAING